jgi:hypothetical protein
MAGGYLVASDIGGTFTDTVVLDEERRVTRHKSPTMTEEPALGVVGEACEPADGGVLVRCRRCEGELGALGQRWRDLARTLRLSPDELGPLVSIDAAFAAVQHVCPRCGASLWVEVVPDPQGASWTDFSV